jgi:hypothetical protein
VCGVVSAGVNEPGVIKFINCHAAFREVLEEGFVIDMTNTAADNYATAREIINHIKAAGLNLSDTKIGQEMGKLGFTKADKKIAGKTVKVYAGLKSS